MASKCTVNPPENHITTAKVITPAPFKTKFRLIARRQITHIAAMIMCAPLVISQNRRALQQLMITTTKTTDVHLSMKMLNTAIGMEHTTISRQLTALSSMIILSTARLLDSHTIRQSLTFVQVNLLPKSITPLNIAPKPIPTTMILTFFAILRP